jgi:formate dehydrogenase gamma subunit
MGRCDIPLYLGDEARPAMRIIFAAILLLTAPAVFAQGSTEECVACHDTVHAEKFAGSVHAPLECTGCHSDVAGVPHDPKPKPVDCAGCHTDAVAAWDSSLHAKAVREGTARGAKCADCHGSPHEILPSTDPRSPTNDASLPKTCSTCHAQKFVMEKAGLSAQPAVSYQASVHGMAKASGNGNAADCVDCHDSHAVLPANNPQSKIFKFNVGRMCGECHEAIAVQYSTSVHGKALARGNWTSPVCTDCHGIHTIAATADLVRGPRASCARCHEGVRLTQEFAVAANRVSSYAQSYHGLAKKFGSDVAADCASCHGAHNVLPSSDPKSAIHPANLQKTCGKCHEGATEKFTVGKIHLDGGGGPDSGGTPARAVSWIRTIYIWLIAGTIGFMVLHNIMIWVRKARLARKNPDRTVTRMTLNQRIQHGVMVVSFTVLVFSGFALTWPDSFFALPFGPSEAARRIVHRIAAVVMIAVGLYHMAYMMFTREGRQGLRDLMMWPRDAKDLFGVIRYYLGRSKEKPEFGRFSYAEKMEYWAGAWGTLVMAITGLVMWYSVQFATWLPRWWVDIATAIHFYEAILATLAIIVWHLYHVILDPDVYPMNWAWFDGKMSKHLYQEEHGLEAKKTIGKEIESGA